MIPWRAKIMMKMRMHEKMTMRMPGMPGISVKPRSMGSSTNRSHSPPQVKRKAPRTAPVVLPRPPITMMIRRLNVRKKVKSVGEIVVIRWASRPPPIPWKKPLVVKASILCQ